MKINTVYVPHFEPEPRTDYLSGISVHTLSYISSLVDEVHVGSIVWLHLTLIIIRCPPVQRGQCTY